MRYIFIIIILAAAIFIPLTIKSGTNVDVLVGNGCGPVANKTFTVSLNNGKILSGVTDKNGKWSTTVPDIVSGGVYESVTMLLTERAFPTVVPGVWELHFHEYTRQCN